MRPSNPIINVRRPTLSLRTRVACALVRALQSLAIDPRRLSYRLCRWSLLSTDRQASCACIPHVLRTTGWHALLRARALRWLFVAQNVALWRRHVASTSSSAAFSGNCRHIAPPITSSFAHPRCALLYTGLPGRKHTEAHPPSPAVVIATIQPLLQSVYRAYHHPACTILI